MNAISRIDMSSETADGGAQLVQLSQSLASPVARGLLPSAIADAAILTAAIRAKRSGRIQVDPIDFAQTLQHVLKINVHNQAARRSVAEWRIQRTTAPMIAIRKAPNRIFAEAHGANGDAGFPLREFEVADVVCREIVTAMRGLECGE